VTRVPGYEGADTLSALFELSAARHGARPMLGTRAVLATQPSPGRGPAKSELGDFSWLSYQDAAESVISFGAGLRALGLPPRAVVALFADTSAHWLIAAHACFREGFTVATVYTSLGAAGVQQALAASDAAAVITDAAGAKVMAATDAASAAQRVILLPPRAAADDGAIAADAAVAREALPAATRSHTWREVVDAAPQANEMQRRAPEPADVALIMFTSGSTGTPKGVLLSHSAVVAAIAGILTWNQHAAATLKAVPGAAADVAAAAGPNDRALAYLPLAHIFEFVAEHAVCLAAGVPLGYGSPATLTDAAPGVARGSRGDAPALRATFLTAVPTVLERVRASVDGGLRALRGAKGAVARPAFGLAYAVGDAALRRCGVYGAGAIISSGPHAHTGGGCALVARAASSLCASVFAAPRAALGGGVRFFLSGGAPLSPSTQRYLQIVFGCPVLQGYGLTETCCSACPRYGCRSLLAC
jgi:long-chain acyl-CoA synthetase